MIVNQVIAVLSHKTLGIASGNAHRTGAALGAEKVASLFISKDDALWLIVPATDETRLKCLHGGPPSRKLMDFGGTRKFHARVAINPILFR